MIPFNRATFDGKELTYLAQAVLNGHVSGNGPFTTRAQSMLELGHGSGTALLATSCTHALEMAARLLDLQPGDEVIVPSYAFVTTASAFMLHGGRPVFADVRADTLNLDLEDAERAITPRTRAICIVHYGGVGAEPDRFAALAERYGVALIEDNAHGLFGTYRGQILGTFGALSALSFHETKNVTCGEGGALIVNNPELVERAEILRDKGTNRSRFSRGQVDKYTWVDLGSSWAMSDLLAGVLVGQLERFDMIQTLRDHIWDRYSTELADWATQHHVTLPLVPEGCDHTSHLFHLRMQSISIRDRFIAHLREAGVTAVFHYQALHLSAMGQNLGGWRGQCPISEAAADTLVRLPVFVDLSSDDQNRIIDAVRSFQP